MQTQEENDAMADAIVAFFKAEFSEDVVIERTDEGHEIATDAGASFTFEIRGATRAEAARNYFEHIRSVHRFVIDNKRSGPWIDGGRKYRPEDKQRARARIAKLDAFAASEFAKPGVYRHFKHGNLYEVYGIVPDAGEMRPGEAPRPPLVFYRQMYAPFGYCYRTVDDFTAIVDRRRDFGYAGPRFTFVRPL